MSQDPATLSPSNSEGSDQKTADEVADQPSHNESGSAVTETILPEANGHDIDLREVLKNPTRRLPLEGSQGGTLKRALLITSVLVALTVVAALLFGPLNATRDETGATFASVTVPTTTAAAVEPEPATVLAAPEPVTETENQEVEEELAAEEPAPSIEPVGEGYEIGELTFSSTGIGPLRIGDDAEEVLGVLTASLGQPDQDSGEFISSGEYGTCVDDTIRTVHWGPLIVMTGGETHPEFLGFGVDTRVTDADGPAAELHTLSGVRAGDSVAALESVYEGSYGLDFANSLGEGPIFEITSGSTILLWGPVTSPDPEGTVQGIFSPLVCEG
jgi:hypothetical protein